MSGSNSTGCASSTDFTALQHRLSVLESLLAESGIIAPGTLDDLVANPQQSKPKPSQGQQIGTSLTAAGVPKVDGTATTRSGYAPLTDRHKDLDIDSDTEGAALTLEHLAFGQRKTEQQPGLAGQGATNLASQFPDVGMRESDTTSNRGEVAEMERALRASFSGSAANFIAANDLAMLRASAENMNRSAQQQPDGNVNRRRSGQIQVSTSKSSRVNSALLDSLDPAEVFSLFYQRSDVYVRALLSVVPDRNRGELLVRQYLERVEWLHRCELSSYRTTCGNPLTKRFVSTGLHVPTFLKQCQELWDTPPENIVQDVYTPFLSLYLTILCVSTTVFR